MSAAASRPAEGGVIFELMAAVVTAPVAGIASFAPMTASAVPGVNGVAAFQPLIAVAQAAPAVAATFAAMTVASAGYAGSISEGVTRFRDMQALAQGSAGSVAEAVASFEGLSAYGVTPNYAAPALEAMTAAAVGLTGGTAYGVPSFLNTGAAVAALGGSIAIGAARYPYPIASGVSLGTSLANAAVTFRALRATVSGLVGGVGSAAPSFEAMLAEAMSSTPGLSAGVPAFERLAAHGSAGALLVEEFRTFVMNTGSNALTEYQAYPFNSYAVLDGRQYGAGPSGVFALDGPTDAGQDIAWVIRTGLMDGKNAMLKRLDEILLVARYDGPIRLRVWTDDNLYFDYTMANHRADVVHQVRAKLGRGRRSRFYRVELTGMNNTAAEISTMQLPMQPIKRRVG
jgi:hypothetical protein